MGFFLRNNKFFLHHSMVFHSFDHETDLFSCVSFAQCVVVFNKPQQLVVTKHPGRPHVMHLCFCASSNVHFLSWLSVLFYILQYILNWPNPIILQKHQSQICNEWCPRVQNQVDSYETKHKFMHFVVLCVVYRLYIIKYGYNFWIIRVLV